MGQLGIALFGKRNGLEIMASRGVGKGVLVNEKIVRNHFHLDTNDNISIESPNQWLFSTTKFVYDGFKFITFDLYLHTRDPKDSNGFVGSSILLNDLYVPAQEVKELLFNQLSPIHYRFPSDPNIHLDKLHGEISLGNYSYHHFKPILGKKAVVLQQEVEFDHLIEGIYGERVGYSKIFYTNMPDMVSKLESAGLDRLSANTVIGWKENKPSLITNIKHIEDLLKEGSKVELAAVANPNVQHKAPPVKAKVQSGFPSPPPTQKTLQTENPKEAKPSPRPAINADQFSIVIEKLEKRLDTLEAKIDQLNNKLDRIPTRKDPVQSKSEQHLQTRRIIRLLSS